MDTFSSYFSTSTSNSEENTDIICCYCAPLVVQYLLVREEKSVLAL